MLKERFSVVRGVNDLSEMRDDSDENDDESPPQVCIPLLFSSLTGIQSSMERLCTSLMDRTFAFGEVNELRPLQNLSREEIRDDLLCVAATLCRGSHAWLRGFRNRVERIAADVFSVFQIERMAEFVKDLMSLLEVSRCVYVIRKKP